jgi:hypothetical protein
MSKLLQKAGEFLKDEAKSGALTLLFIIGTPALVGAATLAWSALSGRNGPVIFLFGLAAFVLTLVAVLLLRRIRLTAPQRKYARSIAALAFFAILIIGINWLVGALQELEGYRSRASSPVPSAVVPENPEHAAQLVGLGRLKDENRDLRDQVGNLGTEISGAKQRLESQSAEITRLTTCCGKNRCPGGFEGSR